MSELTSPSSQFEEWTFVEDEFGVVYCLGRNIEGSIHEAVAVYERSDSGTKYKLDTLSSYKRVMYHGFPEENSRLDNLSQSSRASILGNMSLSNSCIFLDPSDMEFVDEAYKSVEDWLNTTDSRRAMFRQALEQACGIVQQIGLSLEGGRLYGGASFGLVGQPDKRVDDVDFLLDVSSAELYEATRRLQTPYTWDDIDPSSILSERRKLLKAKRWSTSQVRILEPDFLSIDLKVRRDPDADSLWDNLHHGVEPSEIFEAKLKIVDDSESYCTSPALSCEDAKGNELILLLRGYPYIGCALKDDIITVRGRKVEDSPVVLVTQSSDDLLIPDFSNVPISNNLFI